MASKRTVQFEFLVDADARQIDKFHDALKRMGDGSATSEKTLTSLRDELQRFASISDKTENNLQAQIAALTGASRSASLTQKEYIKLRTEVQLLQREYTDLTTGIVGVGKAYEQAGRQAEAFERRAKKIAERQKYVNTSEGRSAGFRDEFNPVGTPQVQRNPNGGFVAYPATSNSYTGIGDAGRGQYGPSEEGFRAAASFKQAQDQILAQNRQYYQQLLEGERNLAAQEEAVRNQQHQAMLANNKALEDTQVASFDKRLAASTAFKTAQQQILEGNRLLYQQAIELEVKRSAQESSIRDDAHKQMLADNQRAHAAAVEDFDKRLRLRVAEKQALQQQIEDERKMYRQLIEQRDNAFDRRAQKIADRQQYAATKGQGRENSRDDFQGGVGRVNRDENGNLIGFPGRSSRYFRMGDMGLGQYGPSEQGFNAAKNLKQAQDQILAQNRQYQLQMLESERKFAADQDRIRDQEHQAMLADNKRRHEAELADFDRRLESRSKYKEQRQKNLKDAGRTVRNVAAAGFFGGPEALSGAAIGGIMGGPAGAEIGAGIGLAVGQLRMQATAVSNLVAELNLAKTTLAQVSTGQADYSQKLQFARQVSTDYSVGLQATIEGYAKVTAAASANGLTLKETETIYKGLLASGVAFGASQDDLKSIITATTQILSKGKISAEELSGQLGERIPGAVAKFAQATGRPLAQLAKDLQDGKVKIADFVKFAKGQLTDYDAAAKLIGSSPEKAGERLNLALTRMAETYGTFFQSVGAGFQDLLTGIVNWANNSARALFRVISRIRLFVNDLKFEVGVVSRFLDIDSRKPANNSSNNIVTPYGSFSSQKPSAAQQATARRNGPMPYGSFSGSAKPPAKTDRELAREKWLADSDARLLGGKMPTQFGGNQAAPLLGGDLTATDDKAAKKAEAEAKRLQALADKETQRREKLEADERRRAELLAENAIKLADRVFEHQQSLVRKRYELENSLIEATRRAQEAALIGPAREALSLTNRLATLIEASKKSIADGKEGIAAINQEIKSGKASAANTARYADVPYSEVGTAGAVGGGGRTGFPEFVSANQMRAWLKSQGYERTRGDFTNRGHRTKNHMLNAIDIGELDGSYPFAVQRAKDLEARLRRTGAFGDQLFGPTRDPRGHKDHVHIPTPEGRIRVTPGLAQEMQLGTTTARNQPITPRTQPGVVSGLNRNIGDNGGVELSQADLKSAKEQQKLLEQNAPKLLQQQLVAEILASTEGYRTQTEAIKDQQQELKLRNRLQMEGVKPQIIDQQLELNAAYRTQGRNLTQLQKNLLNINKESDPELYNAQVKAINQVTDAYRDQIEAQEALNAYVNDKRDTFLMSESVVAGVDGYTNSIGTLNEAVTNLTQKGIGGLSSSLKELLMTGTTDFRAFALSLISDMMDIVLQQGIVSRLAQTLTDSFRPKSSNLAGAGIGFAMNSIIPSLFGGAGPVQFGAGGGGTAGFGMGSIVSSMFSGAGPVKFARGGVMTSHGPLKLQTYARGGIASSPQLAMFGEGSMPEAYVPLPDGKRIPVAVSYPAIPGIPTGGGDSAAQEQAGSIGGSTFERTDAVINRMVASARQESAARAAATAASAGGGTVRVQLETTRINSVDYVTLDQAQAIADARANRATARQQRALQANPSARRSVGI